MFDLLNHEREILVSQISEERNARKKSELNRDLSHVRGVLQDLLRAQ